MTSSCAFFVPYRADESSLSGGMVRCKKRNLPQQNAALLLFDDGPRRKGKSLAEA